jgi:hypothetical protein
MTISRSARLRGGSAVLALGAIGVLEQVRIVLSAARTVTNDDLSLLWYAAREWGRLRVRQPNFYGQAYGSTLEAIPTEVFRRLGVSLWTATPLAMGAIALAGWFLLAAAAWRRSHRTLALVAIAAPLVLSAYHSFYATSGADLPGPRLLVIGGAAALIARPRRVLAEGFGWTLLGLGLLMDPSALLLAAPVAAWHLLSARPLRLRPIALGAVIPVAWLAWWFSFYRAHPDYNIHVHLELRPSLHQLLDSFTRMDRFFSLYVPEVARLWVIPLVGTLVLVLVLVASGRPRYVIPAVLVPLVMLLGMATPKANDYLGPYLTPGRILLVLPYAAWFLVFLAVESGVLRSISVRAGGAAAVVVALALASVGLRSVDFEGRVLRERDRGIQASFLYPFHRTGDVRDVCGRVRRAAAEAHASIAVFTSNRTLDYACGALDYGRLDTLHTTYERRTWRLYEELRRERSAALIWGIESGFCARARQRVDSCEPVSFATGSAPEAACARRGRRCEGVIVRFAPQSVLAVLARLELPVRAFGPDCRPRRTARIDRVVCSHPVRLTSSRR